MYWIDSTDIANWAGSHNAKGNLPWLIRKLIRATHIQITSLEAPKGDDVYIGGYDLVVNAESAGPYVPFGVSFWELGTDVAPKGKAEKDYVKRKNETKDYDPSHITYVFVTPRKWRDKEKWAKDKRDEKYWKDVQVLDAKNLEEWVELAPAIHIWFATIMGRNIEGLESLEEFWNEYSVGPDIKIPHSLLTVGREKQVAVVTKFYKESPDILAISANTTNEAIAFVAAVAIQNKDKTRDSIYSKTLIAKSYLSFKQIIKSKTFLTIIPTFPENINFQEAINAGHKIILPRKMPQLGNKAIALPLPNREGFVKSLEEAGFGMTHAETLRRESGRQIAALRRILKFPETNQPIWNTAEAAADLIPALIAGQWQDNDEGDKEILNILFGETEYQACIKRLSKWMHLDDSPITKIGDTFRFISLSDTWVNLGHYILPQHIESLSKVSQIVLGEIDPSLELDLESRSFALLYDKQRKYSTKLRKGLASSLILLAMYDNTGILANINFPQQKVNDIVFKILDNVTKEKLMSLKDIMPLLAEASPGVVLVLFESLINDGQKNLFESIYSEESSSIFAPVYHPTITRSIQAITNFPDYFARGILLLAQISAVDPGGNFSGRPHDLLTETLVPWNPHVVVPSTTQLKGFELLISRFPQIGIAVGVRILETDIIMHNMILRFRSVQMSTKPNLTHLEISKYFSKIEELIMTNLTIDTESLPKLIQHSTTSGNFQKKLREFILNNIEEIKEKQPLIRSEIRKLIHHTLSYPISRKALEDAELPAWQDLYKILEPRNLIEKYKWLFADHWVELETGFPEDKYQEHEKLVEKRRIEALKDIETERGFEGIVEFAQSSEAAWVVGRIYAKIAILQEDAQRVLTLMDSSSEKGYHFAINYFIILRQQWPEATILNFASIALISKTATIPSISKILLNYPFSNEISQFIHLNSIETHYWETVDIYPQERISHTLKTLVIEGLLSVGRVFSALRLIHYSTKIEPFPMEEIVRYLEFAGKPKQDDMQQHDSYRIKDLFHYLEKNGYADRRRLGILEYNYFPLFKHLHDKAPLSALMDLLATDPQIFIELIQILYTPEDKERAKKELATKKIDDVKFDWDRGYKLLEAFDRLPGTINAKFDPASFFNWIKELRSLAKSVDRVKVTDSNIGKILSKASMESDIWPIKEVAEVIDSINTKEVKQGFSSGTFNRRGVYSKALYEGGEQERSWATFFKRNAAAYSEEFPVTAGLLLQLAESYETRAIVEDISAINEDLDW